MITYYIVCPLVFLAGFVDSIAGGGGLISLPAYLIAGLPAHSAIATNKMSSSMGTTVASIKYARSGYINYRLAAISALFAFCGSNIGAHLALALDDTVFKWIMVIIVPLTAIYLLTPHALKEDMEPLSFRKTAMICMIIAFGLGIYDGFYGPGMGTFLILLLTGIGHIKVKEANGLAKSINLLTNYTALTIYLINGKVMLPLGICAGCFNMAGNYLGSSLFEKKGTISLKPVMIIVLVIFFLKMLIELF